MTDRDLLAQTMAQLDNISAGIRAQLGVAPTVPTTPTTPTGPTVPIDPPPSSIGPTVPGPITGHGNPFLGDHLIAQFSPYTDGMPGLRWDFIVAADGKQWTLDGDNGWMQGYLTVYVNGVAVDRAAAQIGPGPVSVMAFQNDF
jgi:hypothetical protein